MTDLFERPPVQHEQPTRASRSGGRDRRAAKKRAQRRRRRTLIVVVALLLVGGAGYYLVSNASSLLGFENPFAASDYEGQGVDPVDVTIEPGSTGAVIGQTLVDAGVVKSVKAFTDAYKANPEASKIQPGNFTMLTEMKASAAVALLLSKESKNEMKLTIPEGFTKAQVIDRAVSVTGKPVEEFEAAMADPAAVGLPAEAGGNFEGWFFPSTYLLEPDDTPATIVANMVAATVSNLDALGVAPADRQTVITKASLVEREAKADADRPKMARAIENRLERDMTLDIDAAVAFGLGKPGTEITLADKANTDNLYNLYRHRGLPPGPIASPGKASVEAILNPEPGDWLFWVAVNLDTGETKFSSTMAEHQRYVNELRAWQAENP
ncbi:endolytic transglycosylase MltG [Oerskovia enterophila]|uniref:Endolytic murein transglycosylase n=1 Tax=Oerskovia enterophila TaxID=43678 RepID=A0A163RLV4_9CELL|nr:endolytic transglycosylase MltG [Oerskovia enterophila]KZM35341.1 putative aminodeoxychorismate lyase [Oerskovia enterophila]OCI31987.1 putative aminodeoxychorismate lyase [Oerskovia enterophila]